MLSTTRIFPKTPRLKNHRPKFSGIFINPDPRPPPIRWFHREMRASDSRCVETNARGARGTGVSFGDRTMRGHHGEQDTLLLPSTPPRPLRERGRGCAVAFAVARVQSRKPHALHLRRTEYPAPPTARQECPLREIRFSRKSPFGCLPVA